MVETSAETRETRARLGVACGHAVVTLAGAILIVIGVGMILTLILLPVGIGMAVLGLLAIMWAVDDGEQRKPKAGEGANFPMLGTPVRAAARHQPTITST